MTPFPPKKENVINYYPYKKHTNIQEDTASSSTLSSATEELKNMENLISGIKPCSSPMDWVTHTEYILSLSTFGIEIIGIEIIYLCYF